MCGLRIHRCYVRVRAKVRDMAKIKVRIRITDRVSIRKLQHVVTTPGPQSAFYP